MHIARVRCARRLRFNLATSCPNAGVSKMDFNDVMLERNADFANTTFARELKMMPSTGTVVVGCVDPRVDPANVLGLEQGEAAVIRNVGGRINKPLLETLAVLSVVAKA